DPADLPTCLNCGAGIRGQYCGECGQRASARLISLWELVRDAFGDLFELDSRLWRTMVPLLVRPGVLTSDYLRGRRARYMPPFRMYLVLSLIFFVVAFFDPHESLAIFYEPADIEDAKTNSGDPEGRNAQTQEILEELVREGVVDEEVLAPYRDTPADESTQMDGATGSGDSDREKTPTAESKYSQRKNQSGLTLTFDDNENFCSFDTGSYESAPNFITKRFTQSRLRQVCERVAAVGAGGVISALLDNVPVALIILLPVMALVLKLLYPLSRRYYVEHLLFFVHFHAFLFVLLTLQILWTRFVELVGLYAAIGVLPVVAAAFYIPVYLYKSMRSVYGQGRLLTSLKFLTLSVSYVTGLTIMLISALLFAVFSI
ncbi:MAG: DUF3667 domain-containing protein, partial [Woeseiaceae bacterium]|nr:DUF3667 domain-containing protein [Woeseiaceae bacterium]